MNQQIIDEQQEALEQKKLQFLEIEKQIAYKYEYPIHLGKIIDYQFSKETKQYELLFDMENTEELQSYIQKQKENNRPIDYMKIFSQMLQGMYQLHQADSLARCLTLNKIYIKDDIIKFHRYGYFHTISITPEYLINKLPTFETDLWLVGAMMLELITGVKLLEQIIKYQSLIEMEKFIKKTINSIKDLSQNKLISLLKDVLQIRACKRPILLELFQTYEIQKYIPFYTKDSIKNCYQKINLQNLLHQWKNSKHRDYSTDNKITIFYYNIESKSIKYFYQLYVEIQLLNFIFHFVLHFPFSLEKLIETNEIIILKMWYIAKKLALAVQHFDLPLQFQGAINQGEYIIEDFRHLKQEINFQTSILYFLKDKYSRKGNQPFNYYEIEQRIDIFSFQQPQTLTSKLCINILKNSSISQYSLKKYQSLTIDQMFEKELMLRM